MGFRFDKPDRIRFFSSMFCGMASDKADNPINLHRKGRMTSPGQALLFFRSAASAVRPDIAGRRVCLDRPPQYPVALSGFDRQLRHNSNQQCKDTLFPASSQRHVRSPCQRLPHRCRRPPQRHCTVVRSPRRLKFAAELFNNDANMSQEDDLRGLSKVMDFMRALSILFVVIHIYWYCYGQILAWDVNIGMIDRILLGFDRTAGHYVELSGRHRRSLAGG